MTSIPPRPRTKAGRELVEDEPRLITGEHSMLARVLAIEEEAASAAIWDRLEAQPGFNEALAKGEAEIAAGKGTPFREIRRAEAAAIPAQDSRPLYRPNFKEVTEALDRAWLASGDARDQPRPPDLATHLWGALNQERAAQPAPDPEAIRLLRELTAFCELGTRDARGSCRWCGYNQPKAKQPHALSCAVGQARSFLSKSEARESGGEP